MQTTRAKPTAAQAAEPKDVGLQTEGVLPNGMPQGLAAAVHFQVDQRRAGSSSLMPASTSAVHFVAAGQEATMDATTVSLPSPTVTAQLGKVPRSSTNSSASRVQRQRPPTAHPDILALVHSDDRGRHATVLVPDWHLDQANESNGAVLSGPVWPPPSGPLRNTTSLEVAVRALGRPCFLAVGAGPLAVHAGPEGAVHAAR